MKTKIILVVVFVLALSLALVVSVGATSLTLTSPDVDVTDYSSMGAYQGSLIPYMDIQYLWTDYAPNSLYVLTIFDLESFKTATNGLTFYEFESQAYGWNIDYSVLSNFLSAFNYYYSYFGFNDSQEMWAYCQNYEHYGREQVQQAFQIGYEDGLTVGTEQGYLRGYDEGEIFGYNNGFNLGYEQGEAIGYGDGLTEGYNNGYNNGLIDGKNEGYNNGLEDSNAFKDGILTIFSAPVYILNNVLNFDVLGVNLYSLITSILTIIIVAWVIKKLAN